MCAVMKQGCEEVSCEKKMNIRREMCVLEHCSVSKLLSI